MAFSHEISDRKFLVEFWKVLRMPVSACAYADPVTVAGMSASHHQSFLLGGCEHLLAGRGELVALFGEAGDDASTRRA
ncbi:hypothetical protein [Bradyrhizobium sp. CCBAU 051011]|uniref:hypothetical protein n=1 Tax=Bradyrhizobium sp. CCBAU 051011 TaxID=858422 RepID=UPI001FEECDF2|nr:hypothetical protein [Bradyrhizobium sp. CCBAU 051011]